MEVVRLAEARRFSRERPNRLNLIDRPRLVADLVCLEAEQEEQRRHNSASDELYLVIEGTARVRVGRQLTDLDVNEGVLVPPDVEHSISNPGPGRMTALVLVAPKPTRTAEVRLPTFSLPRGSWPAPAAPHTRQPRERGPAPHSGQSDREESRSPGRPAYAGGPAPVRRGPPPARRVERAPAGQGASGTLPRGDRQGEAGGFKPPALGLGPGGRPQPEERLRPRRSGPGARREGTEERSRPLGRSLGSRGGPQTADRDSRPPRAGPWVDGRAPQETGGRAAGPNVAPARGWAGRRPQRPGPPFEADRGRPRVGGRGRDPGFGPRNPRAQKDMPGGRPPGPARGRPPPQGRPRNRPPAAPTGRPARGRSGPRTSKRG